MNYTKELPNNETALVKALVLAVTAPSEELCLKCQGMAATLIDKINDTDTVNECYKQAEILLGTHKGEGNSIKEAALSDKYMIEGDDDAYLKHDYRKGKGGMNG